MSFSAPGGADATVRGRYELSADAALHTLTSLRDRGREADAALESLGRRMDTLSVKVARPRVELQGFERVNFQLSELEARLDRLDRRAATSRVAIGGGFANNTGGFGGGGFGRGGQGLVAGGPGSPLFSSVGGLAGRLPWWAAALPLAPQLLGGAGALVSSAGAGVLGAGVVGLGGAAPLAAGAGLTMAVARPAIQAIGEITKAQDAYTQAVQRYGRASAQAATQATAYNAAVAANPAAAGAARQLGGFRQAFTAATAPATANVYRGVSGVLYNARRAVPTIGAAANVATGAVAGAATAYSGFLAQPAEQGMLLQLTGAFAQELPIAERSLENITTTFGHLAVAATPFFHEANVWVANWTTGLARSSADTPRVQRGMQGLVNSARDWARLTGDAGRLLKDIFAPGQQAGDSMVVQLDHTIVHWDRFIQNNPGKVRQFFTDGERAVGRIATTVANLAGDVWQIFRALDPILSRAEQFLSFASGAGGGSLLGGAGLLYGAYQGGRGALGGIGPSPGGVLGGFLLGRAPRMGGGSVAGGVAPLVGAAGVASGLGRASNLDVARGRTGAGVFLMGGATEGPDAVLARRAAAAESGWLSSIRGLATMNPAMGRAADILSTGGRALRGAAVGAARFLAPLAAIQGIVSGVGGGGPVTSHINRGVSSALSMLTLGIVPQTGFQHVLSGAFGASGTGITLAGDPYLAGSVNQLGRQAGAVRSTQQLPGIRSQVAQLYAAPGPMSEMSPHDQARLSAFLHGALTTAETNAGVGVSGGVQNAFTAGVERGTSPGKAVSMLLGGLGGQIQALGPTGSRAFARDIGQWAQGLEANNPTLQRPLNRMMAGIVADINRMNHATGSSFADLQRKVFFFNGQILTGSKATWGAIGTALTDPMAVAEEKLTGTFGAIKQQAIGALESMGFNKGQATKIVGGVASGTVASATVQQGLAATQGLQASGISPGQANSIVTSAITTGQRPHARGGMLSGGGGLDTLTLPNGDRAAPGEAYIANRHTMNDLTRATLRMYGKTAWQMIRDEPRMHAYQTGGDLPGIVQAHAAGGHPELRAGISSAVASVLGMFPGLQITSTTGGGHAPGSYHYLGEAADLAADPGTMFRAAQWIGSSGLGRSLTEGIHNPNLSIKFGQNVPSSLWGAATWAQHLNHIHMAVAGAGGMNAGALTGLPIGGGGAAGALVSPISLKAPMSSMRGVPGALLNSAAASYAAGLQAVVNNGIGATGGISARGFTGGGSATANQQLGYRMMLAAGWPASQWPALQSLWNQESGWSSTAVNASSGAYGIPQSLGHGHPYSLGDAPAQIAWGLNYIRGRYGSPEGAWAHEQANNWYARGGRVNWAGWNARGGRFSVNAPTLFGAGERGQREDVSITPAGKGGHGVTVNFHGVTFVGGDKRGLESIAEQVAHKIIDALDRTEGAGDRALMGAHS